MSIMSISNLNSSSLSSFSSSSAHPDSTATLSCSSTSSTSQMPATSINPLREYVAHKNPATPPSLLQRIENAVGGPHIFGQALGAALTPIITSAFLSLIGSKLSITALTGENNLGMAVLSHAMIGIAAAAGVAVTGKISQKHPIIGAGAGTILIPLIIKFAGSAILGMTTGIGELAETKTMIKKTPTENTLSYSDQFILTAISIPPIFISFLPHFLENFLPAIDPENRLEHLQGSLAYTSGIVSLLIARLLIASRTIAATTSTNELFLQITTTIATTMTTASPALILGMIGGTRRGQRFKREKEKNNRNPSYYFFKALLDNHLAKLPSSDAREEFIDNLKALDVSTITLFTRSYLSQLIFNKEKLTRENTPTFMQQNTTIGTIQTTLIDAINGLREEMTKLSKDSSEEYDQVDFCKEAYVPKSERARVLKSKGQMIALHIISMAKDSLRPEEIDRYIEERTKQS